MPMKGIGLNHGDQSSGLTENQSCRCFRPVDLMGRAKASRRTYSAVPPYPKVVRRRAVTRSRAAVVIFMFDEGSGGGFRKKYFWATRQLMAVLNGTPGIATAKWLNPPLSRRVQSCVLCYFALFQMTTVAGPPPEGLGWVYLSSSPETDTLVRVWLVSSQFGYELPSTRILRSVPLTE